LALCNGFFTLLKLFIPLFIACLLIFLFFTPEKVIHPYGIPFMQMGVHGIFSSLALGGIVFAFHKVDEFHG
jgi:amino acid transporter